MIGQELIEVIIDDFLFVLTKRERNLVDSVYWNPRTDHLIIVVKKKSTPKHPMTYPEMAAVLEAMCFSRKCQHGGIFVDYVDGDIRTQIGELPPSDSRKREFDLEFEASK